MKAATVAEKRRKKRAQGSACDLSGVTISAEREGSQRAAQRDTEARRAMLDRRCGVMGWPLDETHRRRANDQRFAVRFGRLRMAGLLTEDAYDGLAEWQALDHQHAKRIRGRGGPSWGDKMAMLEPLPDQLEALRRNWCEAGAVIRQQHGRDLVAWALVEDTAEPVRPFDVKPETLRLLTVVGHALARHFRLRF